MLCTEVIYPRRYAVHNIRFVDICECKIASISTTFGREEVPEFSLSFGQPPRNSLPKQKSKPEVSWVRMYCSSSDQCFESSVQSTKVVLDCLLLCCKPFSFFYLKKKGGIICARSRGRFSHASSC